MDRFESRSGADPSGRTMTPEELASLDGQRATQLASTSADAAAEPGTTFSGAVRDRSARREDFDYETVRSEPPIVTTEPVPVAAPRTTHVVHRRHAGAMLVPASFVGMLAAFGLTVLLGGALAAGVSGFGYQSELASNTSLQEMFTTGFIVGLATLFVAMFVGGWAAGRMARFDGIVGGLLVVGWTLLVIAGFAGIGAVIAGKYDVFAGSVLSGLPNFNVDNLTETGVISGLIALAVMCLGAMLGGKLGTMSTSRVADERVLVEQGVVEER